MARERDSQRAKVYRAIRATIADTSLDMSLDRLHQTLDRTRDRAPILKRYGRVDFYLTDGRGHSRAGMDLVKKTIHAPKSERNAIWILVEYAHIVFRFCSGERKNRDDLYHTHLMAWHGWGYCSVLLDLVYIGIGEKEADVLKTNFKIEGVQFRKTITRETTPEQKEANKVRGIALAEKMKRRRLIEKFLIDQPGADLLDPDTFVDDDWETLFRLWCP